MPERSDRDALKPEDIIAKSFDLTEETTGQVEGCPTIIVQQSRRWLPATLLAPLCLILACGGFLVGRATRPAWNRISPEGDRRVQDRNDLETRADTDRGVQDASPQIPHTPAAIGISPQAASRDTREPEAGRGTGQSVAERRDQDTEGGSDRAPNELSKPRPAFKVGGGSWRIDRDELVQISLDRNAYLVFGEPGWSEYDLRFQAKSDGNHGFKVFFAYTEPASYRSFAMGNYFNRGHDLSFMIKGRWGRHEGMYRPGPIEFYRWYDVLIEVRGPRARCFLDGMLVFDDTDDRFPGGRVAFSTWQALAHFRRVKVTDPHGKMLWEGLPWPPGSGAPPREPPFGMRGGIQPAAEGERKPASEEAADRGQNGFDAAGDEPAKEETIARRRMEYRARRPVPMGELCEVERALLNREMEREIRRVRIPDIGADSDALRPGTIWKGERTYRRGLYAGKTVTYELYIRERDGHAFKGHKFDNGQGRNRVEVEGWVVGDIISWIEANNVSILTMSGTLAGDVILVDFDGVYVNGNTNFGDGRLDRR